MKPPFCVRDRRGAALLMAVTLMTVIASLAMLLVSATEGSIRKVEAAHDRARAMEIAGSTLLWLNNKKDSQDASPPIEMDGASLEWAVYPAQGAFNLNNLAPGGVPDEKGVAAFARLLDNSGLDPGLASAVADWLDSDDIKREPGGAEDEYYKTLSPPRLTSSRPFTGVAELGDVRGFDQETVDRLRPAVTALPVPTPLDVSAAPAEAIAAVIEGMSVKDAEAFTAARDNEPLKDVNDLKARLPAQAKFDSAYVTLASRFRLIRISVRYGRALARLEALVDAGGDGKSSVIWTRSG